MDHLESQSVTQPEDNELRLQYESLRQLVASLLVLLIVVSGTLTIFLLRQYRFTKTELDNVRPQITQLVGEYNKVSAPAIQDFLTKLTDYEKKNPDFRPILLKYGIIRPAGSTGAVPAAATAPAPAPKK